MIHLTIYETLPILLATFLFGFVVGAFRKKLKVYTRRMVGVLLYNTVRFLPRNGKIVVFGAESGRGYRGNPKYLFLRMRQDPRIRCIWILKDRSAVEQLRGMGHESYYYHSLRGIYFQLRAKVFIHSHSIHDDFNRYLLGGAVSVNTWHGVGLKKVWGANKKTFTYKALHEPHPIKRFLGMLLVRTMLARKNYVISTSERVSSYYPETFLVPKENVFSLGQARNDVFFGEFEEEEAQFPEYIKHRRVITYMPTHRYFGKLDREISEVLDLEKIDAFCQEHGYLFLIKRHMYSKGRVPETLKHVKDVSHQDLDPQLLLKYTDVLITDYSSCYTDYLLLDRPVIFYCYDLAQYLEQSNEMYFDYEEVTPGPRVEDFSSLLEAMADAVSGRDDYAEERTRVLNIFYAKENQRPVTDKQVAFIYQHILKLSPWKASGSADRDASTPEPKREVG